MSNKIIHLRSNTTGSIPTTSSLGVGEIAINVPDGKMYIQKSGSAGQSIETVIVSNSTSSIGTLTLISSSLIISGSPSVNSGSVLDLSGTTVDFDFDTLSFSGSFESIGISKFTGSVFITGSTQGGGSGHILTYNTASGEVFFTASSAIGGGGGGGGGDVSNLKSGSFGVTIDGNGGVITVGQKGYITVPYNGIITDWKILGDRAGTCTIDITKSTFANFPTQTSITGSAPITVSPAAQKASSSILTGWTSSISAGDIYGFTLNAATGFTRLNLIINTIKS
jgi:hypothetical protein